MIALREKRRTRIGSRADGKRQSAQDQFGTFAATAKGGESSFRRKPDLEPGGLDRHSFFASALFGLTSRIAFFEFFSVELFHLILPLSILADLAFLVQLSDRARNRSIVHF
jgi:hypothetical protein